MKPAEIQKKLFELQDKEYKTFSESLIPAVDSDTIIGIRTPELKALAKEIYKNTPKDFLNDLPHKYFEENQLHVFVVSLIKEFDEALDETQRFLPYIDNWATCDQFSPAVFSKHKDELSDHIMQWITSDRTYTCRFGIVMMMRHFLDTDFNPEYLQAIANIKSDEYYINMAIAWYFATALAKQYDATIPYIESNKLDVWVRNKSIQKARESRRVSQEHKEYLKTLKRR